MSEAIRLVRVRTENFKRLSAVDVEMQGSLITIGGSNAQGKTSLLQAIIAALFGKKYVPNDPVRHGADEAHTFIELSNGWTVEQFIQADRTTKVEIRNGKMKGSQGTLDELFSPFTVDPLKFASMTAREQRDVLLEFAKLDFTAKDAERQRLFDQRTDVGRELLRSGSRLESLKKYEDVPAEEVSISALTEEMRFVTDQYSEKARLVRVAEDEARRVQLHADNVVRIDREIQDLQSQIEELRKAKEQSFRQMEASQAKYGEFVNEAEVFEVGDIDAIQAQIEAAGETNRKVRANKEYHEASDQKGHWEIERDRLTREMERIDEEKKKALAEASFPLPGLSITEDAVTYNGFVFENASEAERFKVSIAVGLALSNGLAALFCRNAPYLDPQSLQTLREVAAASDAQLFIEVGGHGDGVTFVIEDGTLAGTPPEKAGTGGTLDFGA